jgi:hypothetical protein
VARYVTPNLLLAFGVVVACVAQVFRAVPAPRARRAALAVAAAVPVLVFTIGDSSNPKRIPCFDDARQTFLEQDLAVPDLPIVTESPHAWFPREAAQPGRYLYPLDWDVVLKYPFKARNNATDFHIMERFRAWEGAPGVLTTDEIVQRYGEFLVLQEPDRAWFENLKASRSIEAQLVGQAGACRLWHVRVVR